MLFPGGTLGPMGTLLIGLAITAVTTLASIIAAMPKNRWNLICHLLLTAAYLSLISVVVNLLSGSVIGTSAGALLILLLSFALSGTVHVMLITLHQKKGLLTQSSTAALKNPAYPDATQALILINSSNENYQQSVISMENRGNEFSYVQYRIAPYFLPPKAVEHVANERFGNGNPMRDKYIASQVERRAAFYRLMIRGAVVREIYPRDRLLRYVETGTHSANMWPLTPALMKELILGWQSAMQRFPNYYVAIADESVPMKYHVVDTDTVVLHEPIGRGDSHRLNSIFIINDRVGKRFSDDFNLVWELVPPLWRDKSHVSTWIDETLIPLAASRDKSRKPRESPQRSR